MKNGRRISSTAFTLVELLVVIAIIGILVAMIMPAVQSSRESGRRVQCSNNMKQVALAMLRHENWRRCLPGGSVYDKPATPLILTWAGKLFPYMEETGLYNSFNFKLGIRDPANKPFAEQIVPTYVCPSDPQSSEPLLANRNGIVANPESCSGLWYVASSGPTAPDYCVVGPDNTPSPTNFNCQGCNYGTASGSFCQAYKNKGPFFAGMIGRDPRETKLAEVRDGLSKTFLIGETIPGHSVYNGLHCQNNPVYTTHWPPNQMVTDDGQSGADGTGRPAMSFKSLHPGGLQMAMGDGSVIFIEELIDYQLWSELGTKAGGETSSRPQ